VRTWVIKPNMSHSTVGRKPWPDDMLCCELDDGRLLFVYWSGGHDIERADTGLPTDHMWDCFESEAV